MIIKSHVRGGYRAAANYLKHQGGNEKVRLVEISDASAKDLDEAFRNMWTVGKTTRAQKPLHHVSINPYKDERLTGVQVRRICERLEEKFGYRPGDHQRVIVEHMKGGRQHFHVMWNRISLRTGRPIWPGHHWNKSKQAAREMEAELGLKRPVPRRGKGRRVRLGLKVAAKRPVDVSVHRARADVRVRPCIDQRAVKPVAAARGAETSGERQERVTHSKIGRLPAGLSIPDLLRSLRVARAEAERDRAGRTELFAGAAQTGRVGRRSHRVGLGASPRRHPGSLRNLRELRPMTNRGRKGGGFTAERIRK